MQLQNFCPPSERLMAAPAFHIMRGCSMIAAQPPAARSCALGGRQQVSAPRLAQPWRDLAPAALVARRSGIVVCARGRSSASKDAEDAGDAPRSPPSAAPARRRSSAASSAPAASPSSGPSPYTDALLQREFELWQRQTEMYERVLDQQDADLARFAAERAAWQQQEAALRQEAAELRAQLLYVLAQLNSLQAAGGGSGAQPGSASSGNYSASSSQQGALARREAAAALSASSSSHNGAASSSAGQSPAEQVKAVVDAMKATAPSQGSSSSAQPIIPPSPAPASSSLSSVSLSSVSASQAWPAGAEDTPLPAYAAELAAAVAAVDSTDVLSGVSIHALNERRAAVLSGEQAAAPTPPPPAPVAAAAPAAAAAAVSAPAAPAGEQAGSTTVRPEGPPPAMTLGADDIYWVNQLHTGLVDLGYFPGDDDIDVFFFGEDTLSALMTMQCCEGLPETGITDEATWEKLLGPEMLPKAARDLTADMMLNVPGITDKLSGGGAGGGGSDSSANSSISSTTGGRAETETAAKPYANLFAAATGGGKEGGQEARGSGVSGHTSEAADKQYTDWPVLHEGDGGREVHAMHVALEAAGYYPSEDDMQWWIFGSGTIAALKTCQACNSYPESGVCDAATWKFLLGANAQPSDISKLHSGGSDDEDLADQNSERVWLIGEQRWENRSRLQRG